MVFFPLLVVYALIVLVTSTSALEGDESRYIWFAENLARGYYSPAADVDLWNGPGYPLVLLPFILLGVPLIFAKLLNALFLFGAVIYFYHALRLYTRERLAVFFSYLLGIYPPLAREAGALLTESLTLFLVAGFLYHFCRLHREGRSGWASFLPASGFLAFLALTKIMFGYVLAAVLLSFLALYLWKRSVASRKTLLVYLIALVFCLPYLLYTYSLTNRAFYWGDSGGMSLYWMSTPFDGELGDWHAGTSLAVNQQLAANHAAFFEEIAGLSGLERDDEFKRRAFYTISRYPTKFLRNWAANIGRLLFSYPFSYTPQKLSTSFYLVPNMFVVVLAVLSVYPGYLGRKLVPHEMRALLYFAVVAFAGSSLLSAYERQFRVLVPIIGLWIVFMLVRVLRVSINRPAGDS